MLAVLTLVASGGFHDLLHADEPRAASIAAAAMPVANAGADHAAAPQTAPARPDQPLHGCSSHCAAHIADQAPTLTVLPTPRLIQATWRVERRLALSQHATGGLDRPPRS